jgi:hypothetical protein
MTDPELPELIRVCKEMLDRQDRLIASLKKVGCDTSDAILLRTEIADLLDSICDDIPVLETGWLN